MDIVIGILGLVLLLFGGIQAVGYVIAFLEAAVSVMMTVAMIGVGLAFFILV